MTECTFDGNLMRNEEKNWKRKKERKGHLTQILSLKVCAKLKKGTISLENGQNVRQKCEFCLQIFTIFVKKKTEISI